MGKPALSMLLSLLRDFVLSVPLILVLPRFFGVTGALYSGPAADVISFGAAVLCMAAVFRKLNRLEDGEVALSGASQGDWLWNERYVKIPLPPPGGPHAQLPQGM